MLLVLFVSGSLSSLAASTCHSPLHFTAPRAEEVA